MKKFAETIQTVGLIANVDKAACRGLLQKAAAAIAKAGHAVLLDEATARIARLNLPIHANAAALAGRVDLLLVFGGDGTMLRVAREVAGSRTPILGINVGGLGFLTGLPSSKFIQGLQQIWAGDFALESRPLIEAASRNDGHPVAQCALNDFVISRGPISRMIELEVSVDGEVLTRYRCDGLIVSSPTGSTAYSLSAGGVIISPTAEVFALTPICPHTLSNRSVMVSLSSTVRVKVISEKLETTLTADGQVQTALAAGEEVVIRRSRRAVRLMRLGGSSFFQTLRQKLNWSGSNV